MKHGFPTPQPEGDDEIPGFFGLLALIFGLAIAALYFYIN